jgi:hypothetical protein
MGVDAAFLVPELFKTGQFQYLTQFTRSVEQFTQNLLRNNSLFSKSTSFPGILADVSTTNYL